MGQLGGGRARATSGRQFANRRNDIGVGKGATNERGFKRAAALKMGEEGDVAVRETLCKEREREREGDGGEKKGGEGGEERRDLISAYYDVAVQKRSMWHGLSRRRTGRPIGTETSPPIRSPWPPPSTAPQRGGG